MRNPVCCVMGHVDAGKTSLLDRLRETNYQEAEAGGITQKNSAWNVSQTNIKNMLDRCQKGLLEHPPLMQNTPEGSHGSIKIVDLDESNIVKDFEVPGLLMIDTPGHKSFYISRKCGANLCDIAIIVVDIIKGVQPTTLDALELLKNTNTP